MSSQGCLASPRDRESWSCPRVPGAVWREKGERGAWGAGSAELAVPGTAIPKLRKGQVVPMAQWNEAEAVQLSTGPAMGSDSAALVPPTCPRGHLRDGAHVRAIAPVG